MDWLLRDELESDSSSRSAPERSAILDDIDICLRNAIYLKTHLNAFTHINGLPDEVLAQILVVCARDYHCSAISNNLKSTRTRLW